MVVFTLPSDLGPIALHNPRRVYGLLMQAAAETLIELAADPKHLGAKVGVLMTLHTWGQKLDLHPHVHCVVTGGGLSLDESHWVVGSDHFFLPERVLGRVFRGKFLAGLHTAFRRGKLRFPGKLAALADPGQFNHLLSQTVRTNWVVSAKPPWGGPATVLKYLARYTHKTAISNRRLLSLEDGQVTFRWKDYAQGARQRTMTLDAIEFVRRFLMHVFPSGFVRIRHYGIDVGHRFAARLDRRHEVEHVPTDGRGDVALQVFLGLVLGILLELVDDILVDRGSTAERDEVVAVDAQLQGALVPVDGRAQG